MICSLSVRERTSPALLDSGLMEFMGEEYLQAKKCRTVVSAPPVLPARSLAMPGHQKLPRRLQVGQPGKTSVAAQANIGL
jgi:hypothetical protein